MAQQAVDPQPAGNVAEFTVTELSYRLKGLIESTFDHVRVRGEIGRVSRPGSGHIYLDLKDEKSVMAAVVWKGVAAQMRVKPEQGLEVIATGRLTTFPGQSKYQLVIEAMEPAGAGALMALLEARKQKLAAEGLFAEERKRPLPFLPGIVGIVTSPTGAVIRDMLHGFEERFPTRVIVWPVRVQGESSAGEVAAAVRGFNRLVPGGTIPRPDVLIVARGGGSLEDLWGFNEEIVARAVAESAIPVISAVGHETDWTLIDLVADARAPTPTKAAEWAVPKFSELVERNGELGQRLRLALRRMLEEVRSHLRAAARGLPRPGDLVGLPRQRLDAVSSRLPRALMASTQAHAHRLTRVAARLTPGLVEQRFARARERLQGLARASVLGLGRQTNRHRSRLDRSASRLQPQALLLNVRRGVGRLDELALRNQRALGAIAAIKRRQLDAQAGLLRSLSYQSVLGRGFALVRGGDGRMIAAARGVGAGSALEIEFADGRVDAVAGATRLRGGGAGGSAGGSGGDASSGAGEPARRPAGKSADARTVAGSDRGRSGDGGDQGPQGKLF